jgi:GNAT superfamily N-acetyltransferase
MEIIEYTAQDKLTGKAIEELSYLMESYHPDDLNNRFMAILHLNSKKYGRIVGFKHNKKIIGYAFMVFCVDNKRRFQITDFAIYPEYRNKTVGSKALKALLDQYVVPSAGCSLESSLESINFYLRVGFVEAISQISKGIRLLYYPARTYDSRKDNSQVRRVDVDGMVKVDEEARQATVRDIKKYFGVDIPLASRLGGRCDVSSIK